MNATDEVLHIRARAKRADAQRNEATLLDAAAAEFLESGVEAPIRRIATRADVSTATVYRHFPTRAHLIVAVYHHQVEALAQAGPEFLEHHNDALDALDEWADMFVDFLVTKRGLATVLQSADPCFDPLHSYFLRHIEPVCAQLLDAASKNGVEDQSFGAREFMRCIAAICAAAADNDARYDPRRFTRLVLKGMRTCTAS